MSKMFLRCALLALFTSPLNSYAIEVTSSQLPSNTTLQISTGSVTYQVDVRGTTESSPTEYRWLAYVTGTDIYGNAVYFELDRGEVSVLGGPPDQRTTDKIGPGRWTVPNDGTLHNTVSGYRLIVAIYKENEIYPADLAQLGDVSRLEIPAQISGQLNVDVLPDLAVGQPGSTYQAGRYRGGDIIQFNNTWYNDSSGAEGRQSRPLRGAADSYLADLRLTTNPEFGDASNDDFLLSRLVFDGDVAVSPNGTSIVRKVTVEDTPGKVPVYGLSGVDGTERNYTPQPDDGFLDIGEKVTVSLEQLIPQNYAGAYFVALRATMLDEAEDVTSSNNTFVSNAANKIEILETSSPSIEPASAVSTDNGSFIWAGTEASDYTSVAEQGAFITFASRAQNLLIPPQNGQQIVQLVGPNPTIALVLANPRAAELAIPYLTEGQQIFLRSPQTREVILASRSTDGVEANADCFNPEISANGRYVAFDSQATNLVQEETGARSMIYVFDTQTFSTVIVSRNASGVLANGDSFNPQISQSGRFVVFESMARNLDPARPVSANNPNKQIFLHDRDSDANGVFDEAGNTRTYLVSVNQAGAVANGWCANPDVNLDDTGTQITANGGMFVAFTSYALNMPNSNDGYAMVYRVTVNPATGPTPSVIAVSINDAGQKPEAVGVDPVGAFIQPFADEAAINGDGSQIAFTSAASNFVLNPISGNYTPTFPNNQPGNPNAPVDPAVLPRGDYNRVPDVFVRNLVSDKTVRVSVSQPRVATGTITFVPPSTNPGPGNIPTNQPSPGDIVTINDGVTTRNFTFGSDVGQVRIGATVFVTRDNLVQDINDAGLQIIAYASNAPSVDPPGTGYNPSIVLRNLIPGEAGNRAITTTSLRLNVAGMSGGGTQAEDDALSSGNTGGAPIQGVPLGSNQPSIDRTGRFVAFRSIATNLDVHVATDENTYPSFTPMPNQRILLATGELIRPLLFPASNVYRHDRQKDSDPASGFDAPLNTTTQRVSLNKFGYKTLIDSAQQTGANAMLSANSSRPALSADGRYVSFSSDAIGGGGLIFGPNNLTPLDNVNIRDVFIRDQRSVGFNPPTPTTRPVISINAPKDNLRVPPGSTIGVNATAQAKAGKSIASVQLFINGVAFGGSLTREPFSWQYTLPTTGSYSIRTVVTDSKGITAVDSVNVVAAEPTGQAPSIAITQPSGVTRFVLGSAVTLNAVANDMDGTIVPGSIQFFVNGTPIAAEPTGVPNTFTASFSPSISGTVTLSASATDNNGNTSVSVPIVLSFVPASLPQPSIEIIDLLPGTAQPAGGQIPLRAEVNLAGSTDEDVLVQFVANGSVVGSGTRQPDGTYLLVWNTPNAPGSFTVYARIIAPGASVSDGNNREGGNVYYYLTLSSNYLTINTATGVPPSVRLLQPVDGSTAGLNQPLTLRATAGALPGVSEVQVTDGGSGYTAAPTVRIIGGGGSGATAVAVLGAGADAGKVVRIDVTNVGSGYMNVPTVDVAPPPAGVKAIANAVVRTPTVASVQFYVNGQAIGSSITAQPYESTYTPVSQGSYVFSAVATSAEGLKSQPDSVVVGISSGEAPSIIISNPATSGAKYPPGTSIPISARAEPETEGARIVSIQFFVDGVSLGLPDTQSPFQAVFQVPGEGSFKVLAVATDNFGNTGIKTVDVIGKAPERPIFIDVTHPVPGGAGDTVNDFSVASEIYLNATVTSSGVNVESSDVTFLLDGQVLEGNVQKFGNTFGLRWRPSAEGDFTVTAQVKTTDVTVISSPLRFVIGPLERPLPTIELLPLALNTIRQGSTTYLQARVNGGLTPVDRVDFYANQVFIGSVVPALPIDNQDAFVSMAWIATSAGKFAITARAQQVFGAEADNSVISPQSYELTVDGPPSSSSPSVAMTLPLAGVEFAAGSQVYLNFNVTDPSGNGSVKVYVNGVELPVQRIGPGSATWSATWQPQSVGNYTIFAVFSDSSGNTASSVPSTFRVVNRQANLPAIEIDNYQLTSEFLEVGVPLILRARANFGTNTSPIVEFYANGVFLGAATAGPVLNGFTTYSLEWIPQVAGTNITLTARAVGVNSTTQGGRNSGGNLQNAQVFASVINTNAPSFPVTGLTINAVPSSGLTANGQFVVDVYNKLLYAQPFYSEWKPAVDWLNTQGIPASTEAKAEVIMQMMGFRDGRFNPTVEYAMTSAVAFSPFARLNLVPSQSSITGFLQALENFQDQSLLPLTGAYLGISGAPYGASVAMATALQNFVFNTPTFQATYLLDSRMTNEDFVNKFLLPIMFANRNVAPTQTAVNRIVSMMNGYNQATRWGASAAFATKYTLNLMALQTPLTSEALGGQAAERAFQLKLNSAALNFQWNNGNTSMFGAGFSTAPDFSKETVSEIIDPNFVRSPLAQTVSINTANIIEFRKGQKITLSATSSSGLPVTSFQSSNPRVLSVVGRTATVLSTGAASITAAVGGNGSYLAGAASKVVQIVPPRRTQAITGFGPKPNITFNSRSFTLSARASSGLPVSYTSSNPSIVSVVGNRATIHQRGVVTITASQAGNTRFRPAAAVRRNVRVW
jgi:hypothetical protein